MKLKLFLINNRICAFLDLNDFAFHHTDHLHQKTPSLMGQMLVVLQDTVELIWQAVEIWPSCLSTNQQLLLWNSIKGSAKYCSTELETLVSPLSTNDPDSSNISSKLSHSSVASVLLLICFDAGSVS